MESRLILSFSIETFSRLCMHNEQELQQKCHLHHIINIKNVKSFKGRNFMQSVFISQPSHVCNFFAYKLNSVLMRRHRYFLFIFTYDFLFAVIVVVTRCFHGEAFTHGRAKKGEKEKRIKCQNKINLMR